MASDRLIGDLASPDVPKRLGKNAILCLPVGSFEQHGPHLPLATDTIIAEAITQHIVARWGKTYDLWQLPTLPFGLSREHAWAPGTLSLSVHTMSRLVRDLGVEINRALPTRNLMIVNGHGGNRGILEALVRELAADFGLNACALHLGAMMSPISGKNFTEIHGGKDETSVMLVLAPHLVDSDRMRKLKPRKNAKMVRSLILDPATSWSWTSADTRIATAGVIGDAHRASVAHGRAIIRRMVTRTGAVLKQLRDNQRASHR